METEEKNNELGGLTPYAEENIHGEVVQVFTLTNGQGLRARVMTYGATLLSLEVPDRDGEVADIVLGHERVGEYGPGSPYFGATVGRFANRIRGGRFSLEGKAYQLARNNGPNHLHGGMRGFDKRNWAAGSSDRPDQIRFHLSSPDGEEGFPGEVSVSVTYTLTPANELRIDYMAQTTAPTPFNITNHSYFNLSGHDRGRVDAHVLQLHAGSYLPTDATSIPIGRPEPVGGTPFDFREPHAIGERIDTDHPQLRLAGGYDHTFCLDAGERGQPALAAQVDDPESGRRMRVFTTEPGVQFYSGNYLNGTLRGKGGCVYERRSGFCLETQHYPDSPNQPGYPDAILRPGREYTSQTIFSF